MVLEKENAVEDFRALIGATDPSEAAEGTIRASFADGIEQNIIHGSDSIDNGKKEAAYFFTEEEITANKG
jgi:nucleoside-diphosphate kinase